LGRDIGDGVADVAAGSIVGAGSDDADCGGAVFCGSARVSEPLCPTTIR
jgi:hypothetical protein